MAEIVPSAAASSTLLRILNDPLVFYRIRSEAAFAMIRQTVPFSSANNAYALTVGLHQLSSSFGFRYGIENNPLGKAKFRMRKNDFSNFGDYFVEKAIILAMACARSASGNFITTEIVELLNSFVVSNDNSHNKVMSN